MCIRDRHYGAKFDDFNPISAVALRNNNDFIRIIMELIRWGANPNKYSPELKGFNTEVRRDMSLFESCALKMSYKDIFKPWIEKEIQERIISHRLKEIDSEKVIKLTRIFNELYNSDDELYET